MPRSRVGVSRRSDPVKLRYALVLIVIMLFLIALRPRGMWTEIKRTWAQRDRIMRVLFFIVVVYFIYGLYSMHQKGMLPW